MRIFYASGKVPNGALTGSEVWYENLYRSLVSLGHDVVEFDYDLEPLLAAADFTRRENADFIARERPRAEAALLEQIAEAHRATPIDLFFSYFYSSCATPETVARIRDLDIMTMNWYCNGSYQLDLVADLAPAYDYCLVPEKFRLDDYRAIGANPIYCQEAANPDVYHPYDVPREFDVTFVGARYAERPIYVKALVDAGIEARVWGPGWLPQPKPRPPRTPGQLARAAVNPRAWRSLAAQAYRRFVPKPATADDIPARLCGLPLSDEEMVRMYSRSRISLGFSGVAGTLEDGKRITQVRLRDFEAPMSGAFYMVEYMEEIEEFFEVGKEIVCYLGADDLVEKCLYYLSHDEERERIRLAGHARALRDHTWQRRFATVFEQVGLR